MGQVVSFEIGQPPYRGPARHRATRVQQAFENLRDVLAATDDFNRVQAAIDALQDAVEQAKILRRANNPFP